MEHASGKASKTKNCAECRRLKIKCDRTVPCQNCQRRGTASICPDGTLLPKGHRVILSSTDDLPGKVEELSARIQELEEALATVQALQSNEPHPLLRSQPSEEELHVQSFGALMIDQKGQSRFFGATSTIEWIMMASEPSENQPSDPPHAQTISSQQIGETSNLVSLDPDIPLLATAEDLGDLAEWERRILKGLPARELAMNLINAYYGRAAFETCPVLRTRFVDEYFVPCYDNLEHPQVTTHQLGFIYGLFSVGALHAHEIPANDRLARKYINLSRACLTIDDMVTNTNLTVIDTLLLHLNYHYMADDSVSSSTSGNLNLTGAYLHSPARGWVLLGMTMKLAQSIGLHREPSMWGLPLEEVARRRRTIWELINLDLWASLISGRPSMLSRHHFDVKLPLAVSEVTDADPNFYMGKYHFNNSCLWEVVDLGLASNKQTSYASVLRVDKQIRQWRLPEELTTKGYEPTEAQRTVTMFRRTTELTFREITLMCLHRCYFASALLSPAFDLLNSPHSRSVLAVYASSCTIVTRVRALYAVEPVAIMRFAFFWTHTFSASVILGAIAVRAPDCSLAATALAELDLTVEMFKKAQGGYRARRGLPTLLHLQASAHTSMEAFQRGTWSRTDVMEPQLLRNLGGSGAVLHHQKVSTISVPPPRLPVSETVPTSGDNAPSLDEYLRSFDFGGDSEMEGQLYGPTSDEFLHGVLTGDWSGLLPPSSGGTANTSEPADQYGSHQHNSMPSHLGTPYSDSDSSTNEVIQGTHRVESPPSLLYKPAEQWVPSGRYGYGNEEQLQKSFLWDNFLRELGIHSYGS